MPAKGAYIDITGERYGRLVAVRYVGKSASRGSIWLFRCDCGNDVRALAGNVRGGNTTSCGCFQVESTVANHTYLPSGTRESPTYESWIAMRSRCSATTGRRAVDYTLRGITCCDRWASYLAFLSDMGERPAGTTLDRIDNDKGYTPGNCRWATRSQQTANRRTPDRVRRDRAAVARLYGIGVADINDKIRFPLRSKP